MLVNPRENANILCFETSVFLTWKREETQGRRRGRWVGRSSRLHPWALQPPGGRDGADRGCSAGPTPRQASPRQDGGPARRRLAEQDQTQSCGRRAGWPRGHTGPGRLGDRHPSLSGQHPGATNNGGMNATPEKQRSALSRRHTPQERPHPRRNTTGTHRSTK